MGEGMSDIEIRNMESHYNQPKRKFGEVLASLKVNALNHYRTYQCPCCGTNALTTYEFWTRTADDSAYVDKAECAVCTYGIEKYRGEPMEFGFMNSPIFVNVEGQ